MSSSTTRSGPPPAPCPELPAGLDALWREHGRLPWAELCAPALRLAREGVPMPPAHAACLEMLAPVMTMREGARIYAPGGSLLRTGDRLEQPGLASALELLAEEGASSVYRGSIAESLLALLARSRRRRHRVETSTGMKPAGTTRSWCRMPARGS